jgi:PAS domain S-box-containing protein
MKYPSILNRVLIGLSVILMAFTVLSARFLVSLKKIDTINNEIVEHPFTVSNALKDIQIRSNAIRRSMVELAFSTDAGMAAKFRETVKNDDAEVTTLFEVVKKRYLGKKEDVEAAIKAFGDWQLLRAKEIEMVDSGKKEEAIKTISTLGIRQFDTVESKLTVLLNFAKNKADEFNSNSEKISQNTFTQTILYISIITLILVLTLGWIFFSVRIPLYKIIKRIRNLSETENEIGHSSKSRNILRILNSSVDDLENLKNHLEDSVSERTKELIGEKEFTDMALNHQSDIFLIYNPRIKKIIRWNKALALFTGYDDKEIADFEFPGPLLANEDAKKLEEYISFVMQNGWGIIRLGISTKDEKEIPFEFNISTFTDNSTNDLCFITIGRDISQRLKYEQELELHRNNLQLIINQQTEEIQATNEELKVANEEMAAANEELVTVNETQAALNEELAVSNSELESTLKALETSNEKLTKSNNELEHFNKLFVDREFRIKELKNKVKELEGKLANYEN